jgi:hypothetical protein
MNSLMISTVTHLSRFIIDGKRHQSVGALYKYEYLYDANQFNTSIIDYIWSESFDGLDS